MVVWNEERCCQVCCSLRHLSESQDDHQRHAGMLQPLQVPEWKWEEVAIDFVVGLPRTQSGDDSLWVITERLAKVAHYIPIKATHTRSQLVELYSSRIVCFHGVPMRIVSDRETQFILKF
jgi:hypothetical protein